MLLKTALSYKANHKLNELNLKKLFRGVLLFIERQLSDNQKPYAFQLKFVHGHFIPICSSANIVF